MMPVGDAAIERPGHVETRGGISSGDTPKAGAISHSRKQDESRDGRGQQPGRCACECGRALGHCRGCSLCMASKASRRLPASATNAGSCRVRVVRGRGRSTSTVLEDAPGPRRHDERRGRTGTPLPRCECVIEHHRLASGACQMRSSSRFMSLARHARRARRTARPSAGSAGSCISARAIATRWRMPPDSSCGVLVGEAVEPDQFEQACAALARDLGVGMPMTSAGTRHVLQHACATAAAPAPGTPCRCRGAAPRPARRRSATAPAVGLRQPGDDAQQRALAAAAGPDHARRTRPARS